MTKKYGIKIDRDENGIYVWEIIWLPACYTQADSVVELLDRLMEVADWSIELLSDIKKGKHSNVKLSLTLDDA